MESDASQTPRLTLQGVSKAFGTTQALSQVSLEARAGEVHAVIGENGAGKSTLMKILAGALQPDAGELRLDGEAYAPRGPTAARSAGVAMVYQELMLCPDLSVEENICLGSEPLRWGLVARSTQRERALAALRLVSDDDHPLQAASLVRDLAPAARQRVEIARGLALPGCRVLILDEPTSSLGRADVVKLFEAIRRVAAQGLTVLYISHFLEEVREVCDAFTVLRDGKHVGTGRIEGTSNDQLVELMAGRAVQQLYPRSKREPAEVALKVERLAGQELPKNASLELRRGEVLGIAGLVGSGRTELLRAVFGLDVVRSGELKVAQVLGPASPARRLGQGVGLLSEDRKGEGLALQLSVENNLTLSKLQPLGPAFLVLPSKVREAASSWVERLGIRVASPGQPVSSLSGGNQQKVALARLLYHDVDVLLLDEPTRGVDVRSRAEVYRLIDELAVAGKAILVVSSYLPELLGICDRIAVMRRGELGPARPVNEVDEHSLLLEATGA